MKTNAMIAASTAATASGLLAVRAEAQPKKPDTLEALLSGFEAFKTTHTEAIEEIKAGKTDVVTTEKLGKVEAELDRLQASVESMNLAAHLGGGGKDGPRDPEYTTQFQAYFAKGDEGAKLSQIRAAATKSDTEGGFLAPVEWDRTISRKLKQVSPIRQYASVVTISGAGFKKAFSDRNVGSGWVGETGARPATTTPAIAMLDFTPGELYANPAASQGFIDDAEVDVVGWLADEVSREFDRQEGIAFLSGDGTNKPFGILTYVEGAANAAKHPWGAIPAVNSGAAAALNGDGLLNLVYALPSEFAGNARFFMNRASQNAARKLKDGQNNYLWAPSYAEGQPATLLGEPIVDIPAMPGVAAGNVAILYGDMAETYQVVDRAMTWVLRDPYTNKPFVHFYTVKRVGGGMKNPESMRALRIAA